MGMLVLYAQSADEIGVTGNPPKSEESITEKNGAVDGKSGDRGQVSTSGPEGERGGAVTPQDQAKKGNRKAEKKEEKRPAPQHETAAVKDVPDKKEEPANPFSGKGMLVVDEGDEALRRIPGIVITKRRGIEEESIVSIPGDAPQKDAEQDHEGLMGMSGNTTKTAAKIAIVALIFIIFILYRARSGRSSRRVVRTYPKK